MYKAKKQRKCVPTLKKNSSIQRVKGLGCSVGQKSIHGLSVAFLKSKPCPLVYSHLYQPEEVEGAQAECQF